MLNSSSSRRCSRPFGGPEDLTKDPAAFARLVEELTRGNLHAELEWAQGVVCRPPSNRHQRPGASGHEFEPWRIEAIRKIVVPQAWDLYEGLGYKRPDFIE
jgi:hypothetical protein